MTTATEITTAIETPTTAIETPTTAIETPTTAPIEPTDEALIARAKGLNKKMESHLRKGIEAFYRLGETLCVLYKRRHLHADGRWSVILKQIGISTTTDNHARRFAQSCEFEDLRLFKNKTAALRALGILASPEGAKKHPADKATKLDLLSKNEPEMKDEEAGNGRPDTALARSKGDLTEEPRAGDEHVETQLRNEDSGPQVEGKDNHTQEPGQARNLTRLARIAALLEELANESLAPTADDLDHLDRIAAAVARLKEVAHVAAA